MEGRGGVGEERKVQLRRRKRGGGGGWKGRAEEDNIKREGEMEKGEDRKPK